MRWALFSLTVLGMAMQPAEAARAQAPAVQVAGAAAAVQEQQIIAAQTAYLLELYAVQNGGPLTPQAQADLSRRAAEYFTNGATVTGVPVAGPVAQYFSNGAAVTTVPTSVIPDYTFAPPAIASPNIPGPPADAGTVLPAETGAPPPVPEAGPIPAETTSASAPPVVPPPSDDAQENVPPSPPTELDTAATPPNATAPVAPSPPTAAPPAGTAFAPPAAAMITVQPAAEPPATKASSVLWAMFAGLGLGAVLVLIGAGLGRRARRP